MINILFALALLIPWQPPERPVCPTYYDLGYEVTLKAAIVAPGLARVEVRTTEAVALVVAQVVDRAGDIYGEPVAVAGWPAQRPLELLLAVPPEPTPPDYEIVPGALVRTWRANDSMGAPVCRQALLMAEARGYVPWVVKGP
jgi:hypothetical protein